MALWKYCLEKTITISITDRELVRRYSPYQGIIYHKWFTLIVAANYINIVIKEGYAWDGCSPKFKLLGLIVGIWDGPYSFYTHKPQAYYASLVHDVLCQFRTSHKISRPDMDLIFYYLLKRDKFVLAPLYYVAVRLFATLAGRE